MTELPLFPLSGVLLPYGRMPLQIFEQRYLDLVKDCLRNDSGFGVVWLRRGAEVASGENGSEFGDYGTVARIVDWDQLPNGLLGITIEGSDTFELHETRRADNGLVIGEVSLDEALSPLPMIPAWSSLEDVLRSLEGHPHVERMALDIDYGNAWQVGFILAQLLPLEEAIKYELLGSESLDVLMRELDIILNQISGTEAG
ncbi:MAG: LON peptidase substrate-binding domain-containing protein [Pseudomonadota bacterium]